MTVSNSYYELLGVAQTSDLPTLKKAFHRLSKTVHPDTTLLPADEAATKFYELCEAYELLSDPVRRKVYDDDLKKKMFINDIDIKESVLEGQTHFREVTTKMDNRRPLSGGELFSLLLLCMALCMSLLLGIGFAVLDGKELQVSPSWLSPTPSQLLANETTT